MIKGPDRIMEEGYDVLFVENDAVYVEFVLDDETDITELSAEQQELVMAERAAKRFMEFYCNFIGLRNVNNPEHNNEEAFRECGARINKGNLTDDQFEIIAAKYF